MDKSVNYSSIITEIKNRIKLEDLFRENGYQLQHAGIGRKKTKCPFHKERTPSMVIFNDSQSYHCFGCGESGDVISFFSKTHILSFRETVFELAKIAGIEIDEESTEKMEVFEKRMKLIRDIDNIFKIEYKKLPNNHPVKQSIRDRGLDPDKDWYGLAPEDTSTITTELLKTYTLEDFEAIKMLNRGNGLFFFNRLMFTINNYMGRPIAFSGRKIDETDTKAGKYINSQNSEIFDKSKALFNIDKAKKYIKEKKEVYVVEGQFDVIAMYDNGYHNVVASSGTAFTKEQATVLMNMIDNGKIIFMMDGDNAGRKAIKHIFDTFPELHTYAEVVLLPDGQDPCDYLKENKTLPLPEPLLMAIYNEIEKKVKSASTVEDRIRLAENAYKIFINKIDNTLLRNEYSNKIRTLTGLENTTKFKKQEKAESEVEMPPEVSLMNLYIHNKAILDNISKPEDFPNKYQRIISSDISIMNEKEKKAYKWILQHPVYIEDELQVVSQYEYLRNFIKKKRRWVTLWDNQEEYIDYENSGGQPSGDFLKIIAKILKFLFATIMLPATLISFGLTYLFFMKSRWKIRMIILISFSLILTEFAMLLIIDAAGINLTSWVSVYLIVMTMLGYIGFILRSLYYAFKLKTQPKYKSIKESWAHDFEYVRTPFEEMKDKNIRGACLNGEAYSYEGGPLGVIDEPVLVTGDKNKAPYLDNRPSIVYKYYDESMTHAAIVGASGSGKSVTMLNQVYNDILVGKPVIYIDCKNSLDVVYNLSRWAKAQGREFYHFSPGPQEAYNNRYNKYKSGYDPFYNGSVDSISDTIVNLQMFDTSSSVYKERTKTVATSIAWLLENTDPKDVPSIPWEEGILVQFYSALKVDNLYALINSAKRKFGGLTDNIVSAEKIYQAIKGTKDPEGLAAQAGQIYSILGNLMLSSYGRWLTTKQDGNSIKLAEIIGNPNGPVVLFSLASLEGPDTAKRIGGMILSNISQIVDYKNKTGSDEQTLVYIDEVQTLDIPMVIGLIEKARSAKVGINLSMQSLEQIIEEGYGDGMITRVLDACSNIIIHAGATYDSAERFAKASGEYNKTTYKVTQRGEISALDTFFLDTKNYIFSSSTEKAWKVDTKDITELSKPTENNGYKSTAYYINKGGTSEKRYRDLSSGIARKFQSIVPIDISSGVPEDFKREYNKGFSKIKESLAKDDDLIDNEDNNFKIEEIKKDDSSDIINEKYIKSKPVTSRYRRRMQEQLEEIPKQPNKTKSGLPDIGSI